MKMSKLVITAALFIGLASVSFAGPGAGYFQRRAKSPAATLPTSTLSTDATDKAKPAAKSASCGKCRDVTIYQPSPNGRTTTRVVKHECCGC